MAEKKMVEVEELEKCFRGVSARHGERKEALHAVEKSLAEFPARLADASGKAREKLAAEFSELEAEHKLLLLEVGELERRRDAAYEAVLLERFRVAEAGLKDFEQETLFPKKREAEEAGKAVRAALNNARTDHRGKGKGLTLEKIEELRIDKTKAESAMRLAAARRREFRFVRDSRRSELEAYRSEQKGASRSAELVRVFNGDGRSRMVRKEEA